MTDVVTNDAGKQLKSPALPVFLPMYDWPEIGEATRTLEAALQAAIADRLSDLKAGPDPSPGATLLARWQDPSLLLSQTCGFPLVTTLARKVRPVLTPHYGADGCSGPNYCSFVLAHKKSRLAGLRDAQGLRVVLNGWDSQSGFNALRFALTQLSGDGPFFGSVQISGGHMRSMEAVANAGADICCVDAVCWTLAQSYRPDIAAKLKPIARTPSVPGLPWVTSSARPGEEAAAIRSAAEEVLNSPVLVDIRKTLLIIGYSILKVTDYAVVMAMKTAGEEAGCL
ncbi:phosphate ABC transporter substrate-binding protein [Roseibium aquae]|uniref:Phosphate ABC transporter substrate-binding protein n=1 Tax=Roseibium aquae TaxID=1323746 RepID=A0A916T7D6_9HYPH|nr:PhnD/SsuA/transferrin family substrate-binding protein [Roseibium aquae]GGB33260.1 phosphate ABC transporter substrate-binding protein [Roseibium aquae]